MPGYTKRLFRAFAHLELKYQVSPQQKGNRQVCSGVPSPSLIAGELHGLAASRRPLEQGIQHGLFCRGSVARHHHLLRRHVSLHRGHTCQARSRGRVKVPDDTVWAVHGSSALYSLVQAYRPKLIQSPISTPFMRDRP